MIWQYIERVISIYIYIYKSSLDTDLGDICEMVVELSSKAMLGLQTWDYLLSNLLI